MHKSLAKQLQWTLSLWVGREKLVQWERAGQRKVSIYRGRRSREKKPGYEHHSEKAMKTFAHTPTPTPAVLRITFRSSQIRGKHSATEPHHWSQETFLWMCKIPNWKLVYRISLSPQEVQCRQLWGWAQVRLAVLLADKVSWGSSLGVDCVSCGNHKSEDYLKPNSILTYHFSRLILNNV